MEQIRIIKILYLFLLLILLGFATAVSLAFPALTSYTFAIAIGVHSLFMLVLFFMFIKNDTKVGTNEPTE